VPFKANADRRHHIPKQRRRVTNWAEYDAALREAAISRFKRVIGESLRSRSKPRQATEAAIAVAVLNRMLDYGSPKSVRLL
jgi:hypothetical protein